MKGDAMKRTLTSFLALLVLFMLVGLTAYAALDAARNTYTTLAASTSATNGTTETAAVDVSGFKGGAKIVVFDSGDIGNVSTQQLIQVQTSSTGTSGWSNVTAPTFGDTSTNATIESETLDLQSVSKYLRLKMTLNSSTNVQHYFGGVLVTP